MAIDALWILLITSAVAAFDYYFRSLFRFSPDFFVNHCLDPRVQTFFDTYGKFFRFGGLGILWLGLLGCYLFRESDDANFLYGSFITVLVGAIVHQGEQGWLFLMKKK
ncbi:hypothetical protein [Erythrobacter donghaensis]|uniref:hypothetical protein n=1 Tax=Erythrobacter donghaensis TaxID=267135 RepID=UPI000A3BD0B1|nr:hypothetical protein [Erythrobacter donghaensis]